MGYLEALCAIGKRHAGFGGDLRAAAYLEKCFAEMGLTSVQRQEFACRAWSFNSCELAVMARDGTQRAVPVLPYYYSPGTPGSGLVRKWIYFDSLDAIDGAVDSIRDKILLLNMEFIETRPEYERLAKHKPAAVLMIADRAKPIVGTMDKYVMEGSDPIPMASIAMGDAISIIKEGNESLRLTIDAEYKERAVSENVIAAICTPRAEKTILLVAHYDTIPLPTAAGDNTAGTAVLLAAAEVLSKLPHVRYNIAFAAISAEEIDRQGALDYISKNARIIEDTAAMLYVDGYGSYVGRNVFQIIGEEGFACFCKKVADQRRFPIEIDSEHMNYLDNAYVSSRGVPSVYICRTPLVPWHRIDDTTEQISSIQMEKLVDYLVSFVLALENDQTDINWKVNEKTVTLLNEAIRLSTVKI